MKTRNFFFHFWGLNPGPHTTDKHTMSPLGYKPSPERFLKYHLEQLQKIKYLYESNKKHAESVG
jgi:hypothetical protein